ncbi:hypothetical protein L1987_21723 [Smallanthus sonchifolius]|uniref:Uncharacterized protein n=1 Tax=Smallanthus sonchifolius TaxID=185202 RepID=A0ACB9IDI4_9ASTR|nr:hypothetical protein L1987_21723 [Smallanthus sonchifolius]
MVKSIFIYPIKSCRGISVTKAPISPTGFVWDRHWVVINSKGRGYTQRVEPRLALVQVELPQEAFSVVVRAPGMAELKVSMAKQCVRSDGISVWEWSGRPWTRETRLLNESETRPVDPHYATGYNVKFPDAFPYLLISEASLDAVNEQLKEPVSINRFRPNIFINGCVSFAEDLWKEIKINELTFQGVMLCPRCKVPTINQEDGTRGTEPTVTMMKFRSSKALEVDTLTTKYKGQPYLGQMLVCEDDRRGKIVSVGDTIKVEKVFPSYADVAV